MKSKVTNPIMESKEISDIILTLTKKYCAFDTKSMSGTPLTELECKKCGYLYNAAIQLECLYQLEHCKPLNECGYEILW